MLALHGCDPDTVNVVSELSADSLPPGVVWLDLMQGTPEEVAFIERTTGLHVPSIAELSEIETSSRLRIENHALYLSTPLLLRANTGEPVMTPVGFVLNGDRLITVRFEASLAFDTFKGNVASPDHAHPSSAGVFIGLMEAIVDRLADLLEREGAELDDVSHKIFRAERLGAKEKHRSGREAASLREIIRTIGRAGDLISKIRDSLLGIARIVPFVSARGMEWMPAAAHSRLTPLGADVKSLNDYDAYLNGKIQFLLDATLGLINIEQNNIIKVLTVISAVSIGPTLVASWYGMNFANMPELGWNFGYPFAIFLALLTALIPLVWFKARDWL